MPPENIMDETNLLYSPLVDDADDSDGDIEMSAMHDIPVTPNPIKVPEYHDSDDESDNEDSGSRALLGSDRVKARNQLWPQIQGIVVEVSVGTICKFTLTR